jgi:hypothetical protein
MPGSRLYEKLSNSSYVLSVRPGTLWKRFSDFEEMPIPVDARPTISIRRSFIVWFSVR